MDFMAMRDVYHRIHELCSDEFYYKHSDQIYKCLKREYYYVFDEITDKDIQEVVQEFKDFYGEE